MTTPDEPDDFIVTPEDELLFRLAHNWHQKHNHIYDNAFYDPALNYVYLRDSFGPVEMLTTYTHESAHALISRTSYGMMLIQLFLVSVRIHGYIRYACLEPLFHALTPRMQWPYASVYEALVDIPMTDRPEPPSLRLAYLFSEMLHESKDLVDACTLLRDVEHRRGRLLEVWAQCQEGFATFSQIMWSGEESGLYQKLSEEWFPEMESEERDDLRDAVGVYNARMLRKVLDGRGLPPQYISGCRAFLSLSESVQSVSDDYIWNARMAGLLAG